MFKLKNHTMKIKILSLFVFSIMLLFTSCKKDAASKPQISFTNNVAEGTANANGEYTMTGHISSQVSLAKVTLTKQGQADAIIVDESTAKNKNEYDYSYLISGINTNTTIIMDVYDLDGGKTTAQFLIKK